MSLELKVPPVVVVLLTGALMTLGWWAAPQCRVPFPARLIVSGALALAGIVVSGLGVASFRKARTTVNPLKPETSTSLVSSGLYRWTRNPMYLGFLLVLLGLGTFLATPLALAPIAIYVLYMTRFQIIPEERALESRFGAEFIAYRKQVRRWI
jgi:protein-S-isoprenylcysteine O-methyltransferase Ste14